MPSSLNALGELIVLIVEDYVEFFTTKKGWYVLLTRHAPINQQKSVIYGIFLQ